MSRAVIVVGHERQFYEEAESFDHFLRQKVGIKIVKVMSAWNKDRDLLLGNIAYQCHLAGRQPLLIVYIGHGSKSGWAYGKHDPKTWLELSYDKLVDMLAVSRRGPTLIVNDCCHAGALPDAFCRRADEPTGFGVIAASTHAGLAYAGLIGDAVLTSWRASKPFAPRTIRNGRGRPTIRQIRWGQELDHHFFAKP